MGNCGLVVNCDICVYEIVREVEFFPLMGLPNLLMMYRVWDWFFQV